MQLSIVDEYPTGAAFGCDYFTRAARGDIEMQGPDGPEYRPEKVVITDRYLDDEGQICVGERTIRHLAHKFEMVDGWRVARIVADNQALRAELVQLSTDLAAARSEIAFMRDMEQRPVPVKFIALDQSEHSSSRGAAEASADLLGLQRTDVLAAIPSPVSSPATKENNL